MHDRSRGIRGPLTLWAALVLGACNRGSSSRSSPSATPQVASGTASAPSAAAYTLDLSHMLGYCERVRWLSGGRIALFHSGVLSLLDAETLHEQARILDRGQSQFDVDPAGRTLAFDGKDGVRAVDLATGKSLRLFEGRRDVIRSLSFSQDGKWFAAGDQAGGISLWDAASGKEPNTFSVGTAARELEFSPDGRLLAAILKDNTILVLDRSSGEEFRRFSLEGKAFPVSVAFSPDGRLLASGSLDTVYVWEIASGKQVAAHRSPRQNASECAFSPDGKLLVAGMWGAARNVLKVWEVATWKELASLQGLTNAIHGLAFSPGGERFLSMAGDLTLRIWDTTSFKERKVRQRASVQPTALAWSADRGTLIVGGEDGDVYVWNTSTWRRTVRLQGKTKITSVVLSPDGRTLATGSEAGSVALWDLSSGKLLRAISLEGRVESLAFFPDGTKLIAAAWNDKISVLELTSGKATKLAIEDSVATLHPDGKTLASCSFGGAVSLWELPSGKQISSRKAHDSACRALRFSPDGKALASGAQDGAVSVLDVASKTVSLALKVKDSGVSALTFSPDGEQLLVGLLDATVLIFGVKSGNQQSELKRDGVWKIANTSLPLHGVALDTQGSTLLLASFQGLRVWTLGNQRPHGELILSREREAAYFMTADGKIEFLGPERDEDVRPWCCAEGRCEDFSRCQADKIVNGQASALLGVLPGR